MEKDDSKMNEILDVAKISSGKSVLDIACGTGVMIDYYIERNVSKVTAFARFLISAFGFGK